MEEKFQRGSIVVNKGAQEFNSKIVILVTGDRSKRDDHFSGVCISTYNHQITPVGEFSDTWHLRKFEKLFDSFEGWLTANQKPPTGPVWVKANISEIDKARFWTKVKATDYCWEWSANRCPDGYGMFKLNGKDVKASRVSYAIVNGEIPDNLHVLHKCDNPCCVNPDHLFTGTHQDNMLDRQRKGRGKVLGRASRYHGVAFRKDSNNWRAQAFDGKKHLSLGSYATEKEAALARDRAVIEKGLDLPLNFPIENNIETGAAPSGERDPYAGFRETIENIIHSAGKHNQEQCTEIADAILRDLSIGLCCQKKKSPSGEREGDAVAFAEWLDLTRNSNSEIWKDMSIWGKEDAFKLVYDIFKQQKEKQ